MGTIKKGVNIRFKSKCGFLKITSLGFIKGLESQYYYVI